MSFTPINKNDFECFSVITHPQRTYSSSSIKGVTGSVNVFARRSHIEKEVEPLSAFVESLYSDSDLANEIIHIQNVVNSISGSDVYDMLNSYMSKVDDQSISARKQKTLDILRFTPSVRFTSNTLRKLLIKDTLIPYYRVENTAANWGFTNYNTINFFTSSTVTTSSVLLYPNYLDPDVDYSPSYEDGVYVLPHAFSFDFHINPRYQSHDDSEFHAGTIFHLSSSYALSLVTGSAKDQNGRSIGYRLQLQLSQSADILPSLASTETTNNDYTFLSDDNALIHNNWHHVVVRWGTKYINEGTGSFVVDGVEKGTFVIPNVDTIALTKLDHVVSDRPGVLCVGNYWEGENLGNTNQSRFFAQDPSDRDGLIVLYTDHGVEAPDNHMIAFNHPLNAELHDLSIKRYYVTNEEIRDSGSIGPKSIDKNKVAFYLPPFFIEDSPFRKFVQTHGGILQTPYFEINGTTRTPFNIALSFGVNGHYINLENYVRDFASNVFPRLHHLTATAIGLSTDATPANELLYSDPFVIKRNLSILPCDDGNFIPSYELLMSESNVSSFVGDDNVADMSYVNLGNMLSTASLIFGTTFESTDDAIAVSANEFVDQSIGFTPEDPSGFPGAAYTNYVLNVYNDIASGSYIAGIDSLTPLTIYQRTLDESSNQVTIFDVSNLYYGKRIFPGSFSITDSNISGSSSKIPVTLKDDGFGNIYRADSITKNATWSSVGSIFYDEGIVAITNPHLYFYGKDQFDVSFKGEQSIHTLKLEILAQQNKLNSSSNPCFQDMNLTNYEIDNDPKFVYITGMNFHDDNLNVVAKTQLAQPIIKRHGSRITFKVTLDF